MGKDFQRRKTPPKLARNEELRILRLNEAWRRKTLDLDAPFAQVLLDDQNDLFIRNKRPRTGIPDRLLESPVLLDQPAPNVVPQAVPVVRLSSWNVLHGRVCDFFKTVV